MKRFIFILVAFISFGVSGQSYLSMYNFNHVNQSLLVNPASPHDYKLVVALPGLGGVTTHINSGYLNLEALKTGNNFNEQLDNTIRGLQPNDRINLNQSIDGVFIGFKTGKGYWTVAAQQITDFNMTIPSELIKFLYFGNVGSGYLGKTLTIDNFNIEATIRNEYSLGYQQRFGDKFILGGRYKYISGIANTYVEKFQFDLYSDVDIITVNTDILMNTSGTNLIEDIDPMSVALESLYSQNRGMGFDIGAFYQLNKYFDFSVSALNIGWIKWQKNLTGYQSNGSFDFEGVEVSYPGENIDNALDNLVDSLESALDFQEVTIGSYSTPLPSQFIVSGQFHATPKHVFGLLYQGSIWNNQLYHNYGIMYNGRYAKWINIMLGYSIQNNVRNNVSVGLSLRLGAFQVYALTDSAFGILEPTAVNSYNIRAGISLSFLNKTEQ